VLPKKAFVFVNPFSGTKTARTIFEQQCRPVLEAAAWDIELHGAPLVCVVSSPRP